MLGDSLLLSPRRAPHPSPGDLQRIALDAREAGFERRMAAAAAAFFKTIRQAAQGLSDAGMMRPDALPWRDAEEQLYRSWEEIAREAALAEAVGAVQELKGEGILVNNPYVERWLQGHGAEMVMEVSAMTQDAIRNAIRDGVLQGDTVKETADNLRSIVGLRADQVRSVDKYALAQIADGVEGEELASRIAAFSRRKVGERALLISRTETMTALNEGKRAGWQQASEDGLILPQTERVWIVRPSSKRTCDLCAGFYGKTAPLEGVFTSSSGVQSEGPPLHPACRCSQGLRTTVQKIMRRFWALGGLLR